MSYSNPNWFENFLKIQKEGELMCCWCYIVFTHDGYPVKESWCCSKYCNVRHKSEYPDPIIPDSTTRLYLNLLEPTQYAERTKNEGLSPANRILKKLSEHPLKFQPIQSMECLLYKKHELCDTSIYTCGCKCHKKEEDKNEDSK